MQYVEVEQAVLAMVRAASDPALERFGRETVARLATFETVAPAAGDDLDPDGLAAFEAACRVAPTADAAELRGYLTRIYDGFESEEADGQVLLAVQALEHWTSYLEEEHSGHLYELAVRSLEEVDFRVSADVTDFLATEEMAAEYARIQGLLTTP